MMMATRTVTWLSAMLALAACTAEVEPPAPLDHAGGTEVAAYRGPAWANPDRGAHRLESIDDLDVLTMAVDGSSSSSSSGRRRAAIAGDARRLELTTGPDGFPRSGAHPGGSLQHAASTGAAASLDEQRAAVSASAPRTLVEGVDLIVPVAYFALENRLVSAAAEAALSRWVGAAITSHSAAEATGASQELAPGPGAGGCCGIMGPAGGCSVCCESGTTYCGCGGDGCSCYCKWK